MMCDKTSSGMSSSVAGERRERGARATAQGVATGASRDMVVGGELSQLATSAWEGQVHRECQWIKTSAL